MVAPAWLAFPGAHVGLHLGSESDREAIFIVGNGQGLASLATHFLWVTSSDNSSMSVSGLPFLKPSGSLALSIVIAMERTPFQGRLVRRDKAEQFEWQVYDTDLEAVAKQVHRIATHPDWSDYVAINLAPDSDAGLRFELVE
jgi:hypothetical protein